MNLIIDVLPKTLEVDGLDYIINTDFRIGILFEQLMQDKKIPEEQKIDLAINLYFKNRVKNKAEAIKKLLWFYSCGKEQKASRGHSSASSKAVFSYEEDAEYIYSAFLQQYDTDLQDVSLHWWKFKAMFAGLTECKLTEIMGYRSISLSDVPKSQKAFYSKMKGLYRLEDNRTEEQKEQAIADAFSGCF